MRPCPAVAEVPIMPLRVTHPVRVGALATVTLALLGVVLLVLAITGSSTAPGPLSQLQRSAIFSSTNVGPGPVSAAIPAGQFALHLRIAPNLAAADNTVSVRLLRRGQLVNGARVTVSYSMPAMKMGDVFTSMLSERTPNTYSVREPVLGMPGSWAMRFRVAPATGRPFTVTVNDVLR